MQRLTQRPLLFALVLIACVTVIETLFAALLSRVAPQLSILVVGIVTGVSLSIVLAGLMNQVGWWREVGLSVVLAPQRLLWFLPFFLYGLLPLAAGVHMHGFDFVLALVFGLAISFWKLAVFGLMLCAFLPLGRWRAALYTAVFYGGMHLGSLLVGAQFLPTALLALSYMLIGFGYAAACVRTGVLWPLILANTLLLSSAAATQLGNAPNLVPTVESILPAVIIAALLGCYGLLVMPRQQQKRQQTVSAA